ncbi:hypothetical protein llap_8725 [Limosa lapponica baueri]|uniref:Uncharacterized protein n=1 Tax=Limosa lapponica baueri TaxID=1758121 RepID=A0A2I0U4M0_LIMLA|nr:hypothetical protein llap_8725 [Limosa lapponica baueri]
MEEHEPARCCCQKKNPAKRPKREDLLSFYLRMQDAKKSRSCGNKQNEIFTLPCPDSLRRDIEVLQRFIKMHEPPGDVVHEEVVIVTEETKAPKKKNNLAEVPDQV